nr:hypothetical protein [Spirochaetota bacterium]
MRFFLKTSFFIMFLFLFGGGSCVTYKSLTDTSFYSMIYACSSEAIKKSEVIKKLEKNDRVMIINVNGLYDEIPARFEDNLDYNYEKTDYISLVKKWPHTITMIENGFNQGLLNEYSDFGGFEKIENAMYDKGDIPRDYKKWIKENNYVFNTSPFSNEFLKRMSRVHGVTKILFYRIDGAVLSNVFLDGEYINSPKYFGGLYYFKLIDIKNLSSQESKSAKDQVKLLYSGYVTSKSGDFPEKQLSNISIDNFPVGNNIKEKLIERLLEIDSNLNVVLLKEDDIGIFGNYPITKEDFFIEDVIASNLASKFDAITSSIKK